ncbi:hypothetical protein CFP65_1433 [Kitasatospora sp. MMS16-BH015]|uniref:hypothetical protein n=1 Tax=Kitasatospora sp. MMS16-BH015 TaxID=2018025 RepID=UPI000CA19331|nr:hypothetical protein [Kitasatospora sp. MMS16-BH015]AUG76331.1 hypothetical protein CFP65_1433 [Kitasatospora sp. MMS16-BH015]
MTTTELHRLRSKSNRSKSHRTVRGIPRTNDRPAVPSRPTPLGIALDSTDRTTLDGEHGTALLFADPLGGIDLQLGGSPARRADLLGGPDWTVTTLGGPETMTVPFTPMEDLH